MPAKEIIIIGGGIAGLTAAWELSHFNLNVHLIEKDYFLGGHAILYNCKATEQCEQCNACTVESKLKDVTNSSKINIHLKSIIQAIQKDKRYKVDILKKTQYSSEKEQDVLRQAFEQAPRPNNVIYQGPSKNNIPLYALNLENINQLQGNKVYNFLKENLDLDKPEKQETLESDAIIIATGFQPFNPKTIGTYHYSRLDNVTSALDMECIKKKTGAYLKPSDHQPPQKIAFIQCVGSRNENLGHLWCSRVCCPYALRMAQVIKSENPNAEITIFYMDIQNIGKNSSQFISKCSSQFRFIRDIPIDIIPGTAPEATIRYMDEQQGKMVNEIFDLVVLSVGIMPGSSNNQISEILDTPLNEHGFFKANSNFSPTTTINKGIFLAGTATGPKNIQETIAHATQSVKELITSLRVEQ